MRVSAISMSGLATTARSISELSSGSWSVAHHRVTSATEVASDDARFDSAFAACDGVPVKLHGYALNHTATGVEGNTDIYRGGYYRLPL